MQCKQLTDERAAEEALARSEHILHNLNTGLSRITTPVKRSIGSLSDWIKTEPSTPCKWRRDNQEQITYKRSFGWAPDLDEPAFPNFLETTYTRTASPAKAQKTQKNTVEKKKQGKEITKRTYRKKKSSYLARGAVQTWQRGATSSCEALEFKLSRPSIPPALSATQEAFTNLLLSLPYHEITKQLCFGCVAKLASGSPELRDKFKNNLEVILGPVTARVDQPSGLTDIAETSLSFGTS